MTQALSAALICPSWADAVPIRRIDDNSHPARIYTTDQWEKDENFIRLFEKK
jgi:hypothetical protein